MIQRRNIRIEISNYSEIYDSLITLLIEIARTIDNIKFMQCVETFTLNAIGFGFLPAVAFFIILALMFTEYFTPLHARYWISLLMKRTEIFAKHQNQNDEKHNSDQWNDN